MDFVNVIKNRRSVRNFQDTCVSEKKISEILALANLAPSAGNLQSFKVIIVKSKEKREILAKACFGQSSVRTAPVSMVIFADPDESESSYGARGKELYSLQDATIFSAYVQLAATSVDLSTVWIGAFNENEVKNILDISNNLRPIAVIPIGYPDFEPRRTDRKKLDELVIKKA